MVVGLWELVKFLWSHPIISCLVLLLFSPPFFPVIVYFSPVLLCTGLVAIAMVSMSVGESSQSDDWRNSTGRLHEPALHHNVQIPVKPARESWLEWMRKKEEKAKAWVDSRFLNQDKWHFQNTSLLVSEDEPDLGVDNDEIDVGYRIPSYKAPASINANRGHILSPLEANRDVDPPLAQVAKASSYQASSVPETENIKPISRAQGSVENRTTAEDAPKGYIVAPSSLKQEDKHASKGAIPIVVPTAKGLVEDQPVFESESEPRALDEGVIEVPLSSFHKGVAPLVGISESITKDLEKRTHERRAEEAWESIASVDSRAFVLRNDQVTTLNELIAENWNVRGDLGISVSGGDFNQQDVVNQPTQRLIATEKIIFIDEPSTCRSVHSRSLAAETTGQMEALALQKAVEQVIVVEAKLHEKTNDLTEEDGEGRKDGLDENIESHKNILPLSTTSGAVLLQENPDAMALVKSQPILEEEIPPENSKALVPSTPYHPSDLEHLAEQMEPMMALISNETAAHVTSIGGSVLDNSHSSNSSSKGEREEYDDLTERFNALKKSMSLHTKRGWEEPVRTSLRTANEMANAVVRVHIPDMVSGVRKEKQILESSLGFPEEKKPLIQPRLSSEDVESLESLTARLQKKFTLNLGKDLPITSPPSRPVPALPLIAAVPTSVESDKSEESVDSDTSGEITGSPVLPVHADPVKSKLISSRSKKALTSFLSRRRDRLLLVDPFSISNEGEKGVSKIFSSTTADTVTSSSDKITDDREEGSTTSGRLLKEKMISPLKRVFSMDANESSSKKVGEVLSVKSSPLKEKQSVIDKSKVRLLKLFSNEGGLTNVEAGLDVITLRKLESVSQRESGDKNEMTENLNGVVENVTSSMTSQTLTPSLLPSEVVYGVQNEDVSLERQEELPTTSKLVTSLVTSEVVHGVEVEDVKLKRQEELRSIAAEAPSSETVEDYDSDPRITKSSSSKKFMWSWRNSQKSAARKIGEENLELVGEQTELGHTAPTLGPSLVPSEVVRVVDNEDVKSERQEELPSIATEAPSAETVEDFDNDRRITKSSSDKKFMWSWRNSQKSVARKNGVQNPECAREQTEVGHTTSVSAPSLVSSEVDYGVENMGAKSERQEQSPSIAAEALSAETETVEDFYSDRRITKSSGDKKFSWSWRNSQKSVARKIVGQDLELAGELTKQGQTAMPMPKTPGVAAPSSSTEVVHGNVGLVEEQNELRQNTMSMPTTSQSAASMSPNVAVHDTVENVDVESETQESPGVDAGVTVLETAEVLDNVLEPILSSPTALPSTSEKKEPGHSTTLTGKEVLKSSSEKKIGWTWKKKKQFSESVEDKQPVRDPLRSQDAISLSENGLLEVGHGICKVDVKTESRELPSIDEATEPLPETEDRMQPPSLDVRGQEDAAEVKSRVTKPASEKKFEWSWTKKKRSSEPVDDAPSVVDPFRSQDDIAVPLSTTGMLHESREIMSSLTRFHSSSAIMSPVRENADVDAPVTWDENRSTEFTFCPEPDTNSGHRGSPKANSSPFKRSSISWLSPKTDHSKIDHPVVEKVITTEKKKVSWWPRRHRRADPNAVSSSTADISSPTEDSVSIVPCERSGPLSPFSTTTSRDNTNSIHDSVVGSSNQLQNDAKLEDDDELLKETPPRRARHRRERSDSLPTINNGAKFSRLHGRQASLSEINLSRTPEMSPVSSSGRATDYNSTIAAMRSSRSFSIPRTEEDHYPEHVKRSSDSIIGAKSSITSVSPLSPLSTSSYQIRPSAVRMLDLANEQLKGASPFHRSDLDVRGLCRSSPSAAEIRITDKLKAPLEEILSLLAIGENDEQHRLTTVDSISSGSAAGGGDCLRQTASSSSSSENETSSEEDWSAKSDNEDDLQEQQREQQQFKLPPSGRIRRRLPPYVFCREEEPAAKLV